MDRELLLLKIRNAIADKEWNTACANMETAKYGSWSCDWHQEIREAQDEINHLTKLIENFTPVA